MHENVVQLFLPRPIPCRVCSIKTDNKITKKVINLANKNVITAAISVVLLLPFC